MLQKTYQESFSDKQFTKAALDYTGKDQNKWEQNHAEELFPFSITFETNLKVSTLKCYNHIL